MLCWSYMKSFWSWRTALVGSRKAIVITHITYSNSFSSISRFLLSILTPLPPSSRIDESQWPKWNWEVENNMQADAICYSNKLTGESAPFLRNERHNRRLRDNNRISHQVSERGPRGKTLRSGRIISIQRLQSQLEQSLAMMHLDERQQIGERENQLHFEKLFIQE